MPVYTKRGDKGETYLASGHCVKKSNKQIDLYGTIDELNSSIGLGISFIASTSSEGKELRRHLEIQQNLLFELGSEFAGSKNYVEKSSIFESDILSLEKWMDQIEEKVGPMHSFILPGGTKGSAALHLSRTICRRLERSLYAYMEGYDEKKKDVPAFKIKEINIQYINRLSDYLFMAARFCNYLNKMSDIPWEKRKS